MQKKVVLRKNSNMVTRVIDDETILLPLYKTSDEINCIYSLNKAASVVWNLIDGKTTLADIKKKVLTKFDVTSEEVDKKMQNLLKDLKEIRGIK